MPHHDPIVAKRTALRDAILSALEPRNRAKLSLDKIAGEIGIARTTLTKRLSLVHLDTIEKFARWKRHPAISRLAGELMVLLGVPPNYVAAIGAQTDAMPKASNIIPFPPSRPPRAKRWRPPPHDSERPVFIHAALQLEACDFPQGGLKTELFDVASAARSGLERAALTDLLSTFIDARYFAAFAQALRTDTAIPRHPFDKFRLTPFLYPEKVAAYRERVKKSLLRRLYVPEQFVFEGRDTRAIFDYALETAPVKGSYEAKIANLTATGTADRFPPWKQDAFAASVDRLAAAAAASSTRLYDELYGLTDFKPSDWIVPQKPLLLASASCAANRAELAAMCAGHSLRLVWGEDAAYAATPLVTISSKIYELCHETYLLSSEHWGKAIRALPKPRQRQFVSDRALLWGQYQNTGAALASDEGVWFHFRTETQRALAYLNRHGSLQTDILDDDGGREIHRFVTHDPRLMPRGFVRGKDELFAF